MRPNRSVLPLAFAAIFFVPVLVAQSAPAEPLARPAGFAPGFTEPSDRNLTGQFWAEEGALTAGRALQFFFHVRTNATNSTPPSTTEYQGLVDGPGGLITFPTTAVDGNGSFNCTFAQPGRYRVGVKLTGPDIEPRWIGSFFAIVTEETPPAPPPAGRSPLPWTVLAASFACAALWRARRND